VTAKQISCDYIYVTTSSRKQSQYLKPRRKYVGENLEAICKVQVVRRSDFHSVPVSAAYAQNTRTITVNCNNGQSLNRTLSELNKQTPAIVIVQGTCTEYVPIDGFESLTLRGQSGAAIQQPATNPHSNSYALSITGSQGITVSGLAVHSLPSVFSGIGIGAGSSQVPLQDVHVDGSWGVWVYEESQVWLVKVSVNITSGYAAISAFDKSDVHITGGLLERPSNGLFNAGVFVFSGHVTMQGMTIRDMQTGIDIYASGSVDLVNVNPVGGASLVVSGSRGQGVIVTNNSHATLAGSSITGGSHGGLVVANLSTIDVQPSSSLTLVSGNVPDLFCDTNSFITGTANLAGVPTVNCGNLRSGNTVPLP